MSETKFTRGPWRVDAYGCVIQSETIGGGEVIRAGGVALCVNEGEPKYNRYLIAAAPEMYALLEKFKDFAVRQGWQHVLINEAETLLAKARGEA
jgi:hypothetical protein